jgi:hypothetical protein
MVLVRRLCPEWVWLLATEACLVLVSSVIRIPTARVHWHLASGIAYGVHYFVLYRERGGRRRGGAGGGALLPLPLPLWLLPGSRGCFFVGLNRLAGLAAGI